VKTEAEIEVSGELRSHVLRLEFDLELAKPGIGPSWEGPGEPGEAGSATVLSGVAILERDGKAIRERKLAPKIIEKLRDDQKLEAFLYDFALKELPHD